MANKNIPKKKEKLQKEKGEMDSQRAGVQRGIHRGDRGVARIANAQLLASVVMTEEAHAIGEGFGKRKPLWYT